MKTKFMSLVGLLLLSPLMAFAGSSCATPTIVPANGHRLDFDFVANGTSNYYQFSVTKGHSYSVEVLEDYDDQNTDISVTSYTDGGTCAATPIPNTTDTHNADPALPANATRFSYTAGATGNNAIKVTDGGTVGRYVSVTIADTTLFSPFYTTFSNFNTFYNVYNTTSQPVHFVLTLLNKDGSTAGGTTTLLIPANAEYGQAISTQPPNPSNLGLNIPASTSGPAICSNDGPPGALEIDGFSGSSAGGAFVTIPIKFQAIRDKN